MKDFFCKQELLKEVANLWKKQVSNHFFSLGLTVFPQNIVDLKKIKSYFSNLNG